MWNLALIVFSLFIYIFPSLYSTFASASSSSRELIPRVKIDWLGTRSCTPNQRQVLESVLRDASVWARLVTDTTEDRQTDRPDNAQYREWRQAREALFTRYYGSFRRAIRLEIGMIFQALLWELDRSPGRPRASQNYGGNVVRQRIW